ncbi:MAG TPA: phosphate signaling complex protein PhoU [Actinomycetota bacterium]|nr:phosphate signaling complex protein PhoU [Actinomycetota bacterium]
MTRESFHEALQRTELELLTLGELAATAIQRSVQALVNHDDGLAERVIAEDDEIDELYLRIDSGTLSLLALQSPVAADLRLISAILHSCLHLERVGDQAVNVAKLYFATRSLPASATMRTLIDEMGERVVMMLRTVMDAFAKRDLDLCLQLPELDDFVDRLNRSSHLEALKLAEDPRALEWGLHMNLASRALERAGDNAVDIAEQVGYLVTGEFREYTDASHEVSS